jgi:hypothetical protein
MVFGAPETRMHSFGDVSPQLVERQIRMLVPEKQRVSMNAQAGQVIVVAEPEIQNRVEAMIRELSRPVQYLKLWVRHNRDIREFQVRDGVPVNLPVSDQPSASMIRQGRSMLPPGRQNLPVVGSVLQLHVKLLREDPAVARVRVVPTMLFGSEPPYDVVRFTRLESDVLLNTRDYLDLPRELSTHAFYTEFLREQEHPDHPPKPVSLLLSFQGLTTESVDPGTGDTP